MGRLDVPAGTSHSETGLILAAFPVTDGIDFLNGPTKRNTSRARLYRRPALAVDSYRGQD